MVAVTSVDLAGNTGDPNSVWSAGCSLNCGKFYNKMSRCAGVWGEGRGLPVANVVVGVQMLLLELEVLLHIYYLDILPQPASRG